MNVDLPDPQVVALVGPLLERVGGELAAVVLKLAGAMAEDRAKGYMEKEEALAYLKLKSERSLETWMKPVSEGGRGLPHFKLGETVRFSRARIDAWALTFEKNTPAILPAYQDAA